MEKKFGFNLDGVTTTLMAIDDRTYFRVDFIEELTRKSQSIGSTIGQDEGMDITDPT